MKERTMNWWVPPLCMSSPSGQGLEGSESGNMGGPGGTEQDVALDGRVCEQCPRRFAESWACAPPLRFLPLTTWVTMALEKLVKWELSFLSLLLACLHSPDYGDLGGSHRVTEIKGASRHQVLRSGNESETFAHSIFLFLFCFLFFLPPLILNLYKS